MTAALADRSRDFGGRLLGKRPDGDLQIDADALYLRENVEFVIVRAHQHRDHPGPRPPFVWEQLQVHDMQTFRGQERDGTITVPVSLDLERLPLGRVGGVRCADVILAGFDGELRASHDRFKGLLDGHEVSVIAVLT